MAGKLTFKKKYDLAQLGAVFSLFFIILYFLVQRDDLLFIYISGGILVVTIFFYRILSPIHKVWMGLAELLSKVVGTLLFSILFYGLVTPMALLRKMFGGSGLDVKITDQESFWHNRDEKDFKPENFEKQF